MLHAPNTMCPTTVQVWLFAGLPNYRKLSPAELPAVGSCAAGGGTAGCSDGGWGSNVVHVDDGSTRATCLNPHSAEDHALQASE